MKPLVALLTSKTNVQTYCMAIRAVRNIWNVNRSIRETMVKLEIVKLVAQLFVMAEERSNVDTKYGKLMDACLKAMCIFLNTLDPRCGEQMHVDKNMLGYKCLMRCCSVSNNKMAIKCLYTLCQIPECRLSLGISGTVEELIALINIADTSSSHLSKEMLFSLCLFCRESVNRDRIRQGDGLQVFVTLLNKPEHKHHHLRLLEALSLFIHDDIGLDILTKHGILEVLVAKLMDVVAKNSDRNSISRKRTSDFLIDDYCKRPSKYPTSRYSMDFYRDDWSPRSATSASSSSPPSTPPLPSYSDFNSEMDDLEDNVYSPVCSDKECDNDEEEEAASPKSYKSLTTIEADSDSSSLNSETPSETNACEYYTLMLLSKLSLSLKPIDKLAESTTIKSLMDYIKYAKRQNFFLKGTAVKIFIRIIGNAVYFMPLLKQGLVFEMRTLPEMEQCTQYLRTVAETGGATGQLSFILLRGEEECKLLTAVSIPLLIKTQDTLKCLLKKYGGLQLIFRLLADSSHKLHKQAIWSICQLAKTLEIHPSDDYSIAETATNVCETNRTKLSESLTVTFELDDGTTIEACKQVLCQNSPVFFAMLEGNFSESNKRRIRLRNTSRDGLKTLILATNKVKLENRSIESLLDAVLLADYFLMPDLIDTLTENSVNKLNHENFCRAWRWAKNHSCYEFRSYCIKSFLTSKMSWSETMRTFRDFYTTGNVFDEFLCEIKDIITDVLCQC
ncbi:armadillo repeat-containing protein 5 isoform X2 [Monomorium pharaonis]|nr:armadillo repeat-containing protein 5 isoform X2 [Monomorium pharaonis]